MLRGHGLSRGRGSQRVISAWGHEAHQRRVEPEGHQCLGENNIRK